MQFKCRVLPLPKKKKSAQMQARCIIKLQPLASTATVDPSMCKMNYDKKNLLLYNNTIVHIFLEAFLFLKCTAVAHTDCNPPTTEFQLATLSIQFRMFMQHWIGNRLTFAKLLQLCDWKLLKSLSTSHLAQNRLCYTILCTIYVNSEDPTVVLHLMSVFARSAHRCRDNGVAECQSARDE